MQMELRRPQFNKPEQKQDRQIQVIKFSDQSDDQETKDLQDSKQHPSDTDENFSPQQMQKKGDIAINIASPRDEQEFQSINEWSILQEKTNDVDLRDAGIGKYFLFKDMNIFLNRQQVRQVSQNTKRWKEMIDFGGQRRSNSSSLASSPKYSSNRLSLDVSPGNSVNNRSSSPSPNKEEPHPFPDQIATQNEQFQLIIEECQMNLMQETVETLEEQCFSIYQQKYQQKFRDQLIEGPPMIYRWSAWKIEMQVDLKEGAELYKKYINNEDKASILQQIGRDLHRTFPLQKYFSEEKFSLKSQDQLGHVLKVVAGHYQQIGYCQGMNFLLAFLLLLSGGKEVETFAMFIGLNQRLYLTELFDSSFSLYQILSFVFQKLFEFQIPKLFQHFQEVQLDDMIWVFQWFETLFLYSLPLPIAVRVWDYLFVKGIAGVFNVGIAFLLVFEKKLVKFNVDQLHDFFKQTCEIIPTSIKDPKKLPLTDYKKDTEIFTLDPDDFIQQSTQVKISQRRIQQYLQEFILLQPDICENSSFYQYYINLI